MVRISKQQERRSVSPKRPSLPTIKTGSLKEKFSFKEHLNAVQGEQLFIPKVR